MKTLRNALAAGIISLIRGYQMYISPLMLPGKCRFVPTCSQYFIQAVEKYGPFKGSALGNDFIDYKSAEHHSSLERIAARRACELFNAEHAIVRLGNPAAANRVVIQTFAKPDDNILSFNLRKQEYCTGDQMQYYFRKFSVEPETFCLNFDKLRSLALVSEPKMIIYSPVNYPKNIDCSALRKIADDVGAVLWIDLGQNAGLIAAKKIPSPVKFADVLTFAANDALHGPQT